MGHAATGAAQQHAANLCRVQITGRGGVEITDELVAGYQIGGTGVILLVALLEMCVEQIGGVVAVRKGSKSVDERFAVLLERVALGQHPLDGGGDVRRIPVAAVQFESQTQIANPVEMKLLVQMLGGADDGFALRQGLVDGADADDTHQHPGPAQHPLAIEERHDPHIGRQARRRTEMGGLALLRRPAIGGGDQHPVGLVAKGLDQLVEIVGGPTAAAAGQIDQGQVGVPALVQHIQNLGLGGAVQQRSHVAVATDIASHRVQLGYIGEQTERVLPAHLGRVVGQVLIEGTRLDIESFHQRQAVTIGGVIVGLGDPSVVDAFQAGAEMRAYFGPS